MCCTRPATIFIYAAVNTSNSDNVAVHRLSSMLQLQRCIKKSCSKEGSHPHAFWFSAVTRDEYVAHSNGICHSYCRDARLQSDAGLAAVETMDGSILACYSLRPTAIVLVLK
jgi:hypothetical protein